MQISSQVSLGFHFINNNKNALQLKCVDDTYNSVTSICKIELKKQKRKRNGLGTTSKK